MIQAPTAAGNKRFVRSLRLCPETGADDTARALKESSTHGARVATELRRLFGQVNASGVRDVITYSQNTLVPEERELLARGVVDLFEEIEYLRLKT